MHNPKMPPTVRSIGVYGFRSSNRQHGGTNFVLLSLDGEQAWLEVLGLADPPHPVHFLWSHWTLVQRAKRDRQIGNGSGFRQAKMNRRVRQIEPITITRRGDLLWKQECPDPSRHAFIFPNSRRRVHGHGELPQPRPVPLAEKLGLPKLNFQVLRRTTATLAQKKGSVKDIQAHLRHAKADTTANEYMQELPESVEMVDSASMVLCPISILSEVWFETSRCPNIATCPRRLSPLE